MNPDEAPQGADGQPDRADLQARLVIPGANLALCWDTGVGPPWAKEEEMQGLWPFRRNANPTSRLGLASRLGVET